ncbi:MAG TPA: rhomboid family intramembrane serine protease, partial [Mucilaginibacter sp.]
GIIAYTNISWESYAEEVSVRIVNNNAVIKSECVGYQFFFYDYGKNEKNLELLYGEIEYVEYHLQRNLEETTQQLMDSVPDKQFISMDNPPMGAKERLHTFLAAFTPVQNYFVTPILVLANIAVYIATTVALVIMVTVTLMQHKGNIVYNIQNIYLSLGFSNRTQVLNGQVWRLLTSTFLHFSLMHLAGNMIVLIYIGSLIESKLGRWNYLFLYLFTGICASITSVLWNDHGVAAGASGAIFGLFGILLALLSTNFYENSARRALLISTVIFVGINIIPLGHRIDHAAHFGGLISGYVLGWIAYLGLKYQKQNFIIAGAFTVTAMFTGLCIQLAPHYEFKKMEQLTIQNKKVLASINDDFYDPKNLQLKLPERIALLQHNTLPKLKTMNSIAQSMDKVVLPKKQRQIAHIKSEIILQNCIIFNLLYKEVRDQEPAKYRPAMVDATHTINKLHKEWGNLENKDN